MSLSRKPLFIVPIRDRRQRRRVLTIRNCAMTMLTVAVVIAAISIYSGARGVTSRDYGRLFGTQVGTPNRQVAPSVEVVTEGAVEDQAAPDPMLISSARGEQLLMAKSNVDPAPSQTPAFVPAQTVPVPVNVGVTHGTTIVGDGNGVVIAQPPSSGTVPPPKLSGGIFKQQ